MIFSMRLRIIVGFTMMTFKISMLWSKSTIWSRLNRPFPSHCPIVIQVTIRFLSQCRLLFKVRLIIGSRNRLDPGSPMGLSPLGCPSGKVTRALKSSNSKVHSGARSQIRITATIRHNLEVFSTTLEGESTRLVWRSRLISCANNKTFQQNGKLHS